MRLPRGNPALIALFLAGIVLPSAILSTLSFRSIRNEIYLAEKAYEDDAKAFRSAMQQKLTQEINRLLEDTRKQALWLFDQPQTPEEMSRTAQSSDSIPGIRALFLFDGDRRIFPRFVPARQIKTGKSLLAVDSFEVRISHSVSAARSLDAEIAARRQKQRFETQPTRNTLNLIGLLRLYYRQKDWKQCLAILDQLNQQPHITGMLQPSLRTSLHLLKFKILMESGLRKESVQWAELLVSSFLAEPVVDDIEGALFLFESMFNAILSYENLDAETRERIWNLRKNLGFQLRTALVWSIHENLVLQLLEHQTLNPISGIVFQEDNGFWGFRLTRPWLPGDQMIVGILDPQSIRQRLLTPLTEITREWKHIYFRIADSQGEILLSHTPPGDTLPLQQEIQLAEHYPPWTLQIFQRDLREMRKETRAKMALLYTLVVFSLLVLILGSFFITQGIAQERLLLAMKSNFLSSVSHELKTPLTSIRMFSEMMSQGRVQKSEKIMEYATLIGKEASRLENLIQAILSYTRMEKGSTVFRWEELDFSQCVAKVADSLRALAQSKGLEMLTDIAENQRVYGDYDSLHSLVQNLIDNAIKYTPSPGTVTVSLLPDAEHVILTVADTGIGIDPAEQKLIFNDFYRVGDELTRSAKGSGLGLAIVRRAAEAHHATISVQSKPGKGSVFTVRMKRIRHDS